MTVVQLQDLADPVGQERLLNSAKAFGVGPPGEQYLELCVRGCERSREGSRGVTMASGPAAVRGNAGWSWPRSPPPSSSVPSNSSCSHTHATHTCPTRPLTHVAKHGLLEDDDDLEAHFLCLPEGGWEGVRRRRWCLLWTHLLFRQRAHENSHAKISTHTHTRTATRTSANTTPVQGHEPRSWRRGSRPTARQRAPC